MYMNVLNEPDRILLGIMEHEQIIYMYEATHFPTCLRGPLHSNNGERETASNMDRYTFDKSKKYKIQLTSLFLVYRWCQGKRYNNTACSMQFSKC